MMAIHAPSARTTAEMRDANASIAKENAISLRRARKRIELMGYQTHYDLTISPHPDLERIQSLGAARRTLERQELELTPQISDFFREPVNEAIYQALFNDDMVFALGRGLKGGEPDSQWRTCEDDMRKLSAAAPDHLFKIGRAHV